MNPKALEALFGARHGILGAFYLEPGRWWSIGELAGRLNADPLRLRRDIVALEAGGIVRRSRLERRTIFQANPECRVFGELQRIFAKARAPEWPSGCETILVVEDQPATLKVTRILLEHLGYKVLEAPDGRSALDLFMKHRYEVRLMLTDVVMPDMSGPDVYAKLVKLKPDLRVVYMSGYHMEELQKKGLPFLAKPFNPAGLARMVREVLDRR